MTRQRPLLLLLLLALALLSACLQRFGQRHFFGPLMPAVESAAPFEVLDDHSIVFRRQRLEVALQPLTPEMLNRQFPQASGTAEGFHEPNPYGFLTNPYTYGDWTPSGEDEAPPRFTVFSLRVKNYEFPKVLIEPGNIHIEAANGRIYAALSFPTLVEYHRPYALAYAGNTYLPFQERRAILEQSLYPESEVVFSGQERDGLVVFPPLDRDVDGFTVHIDDVVVRFDFRSQPLEEIDIPYPFQRQVYVARQRRPE